VNAGPIWAALQLASTLPACKALMAHERVPVDLLDDYWLSRLRAWGPLPVQRNLFDLDEPTVGRMALLVRPSSEKGTT
jgi:hypothetical protein